jgi:5-methylcytosine-specific restriction endonuclease McrA
VLPIDGQWGEARRGLLPPLKLMRLASDVSAVHALLAGQSATTSGVDLDSILGQLEDVLNASSSAPWVAGFFAVMAFSTLVRGVRRVVHGRHPKDPQRRFSGFQREEIFTRAGNRCEHHSWPFGRCGETDHLQADHVHPHSWGGATAIENGQVLCRRHNKQKAARVPWNWQLARLARRRGAYFPPDTPRAVIRIRSRVLTD